MKFSWVTTNGTQMRKSILEYCQPRSLKLTTTTGKGSRWVMRQPFTRRYNFRATEGRTQGRPLAVPTSPLTFSGPATPPPYSISLISMQSWLFCFNDVMVWTAIVECTVPWGLRNLFVGKWRGGGSLVEVVKNDRHWLCLWSISWISHVWLWWSGCLFGVEIQCRWGKKTELNDEVLPHTDF